MDGGELTPEEQAKLEELASFLLEKPDSRVREFIRRALLSARSGGGEPESYSLAEISEAHHVSVRTLRRAIKAGELKASKLGKEFRVRPPNLEAWIEIRS